jgi:hypothetical protein
MPNGQGVTLDFSKAQPVAPPDSGQGVSLDFSNAQPINQPPAQPSFWRTVYDRSGVGAIQKLAGQLSDWAGGKADAAQMANLGNVAKGGQPNPMEAYSPRAGYDLLSHTAGLVKSFLDPTNLAITGGVIAANTNPITGIPVDAAHVAHGGYGVVKNAPAAFSVNPDAVQNMLLSGAEAAGGAAGAGAQVRGLPRAAQNFVNAPGVVPKIRSAAGGSLPTDVPTGPAAATAQAPRAATAEAPVQEFGEEGGPAMPQAPGAPTGRMAQVLGVTDPPPNQLLTKAIKPLASNTGWDAALAKAAPLMKAAETDLGHPITGVDDALQAASVAKKAIWKQYETKLKSASTAFGDEETGGAMIDGNEVADAMMKSIDARTQLQNPDLVERIQKVADTYRRPMGLPEAEDFLQSANNDLHSYYAKNKVGRQVAERDPSTGYVVSEADQLRDSLYSQLDDLTGPGAADLKQQYGALSNIENELLRRKNVSARQQPDSLAEQIGMARSFGKIAVGTLRASPGAMLEGVQSLAAAKFLKARGLTDNMITRAFQALGSQGPNAPPMPATPPPTAPAATGAAAGAASPDETPSDSGPIASPLNRYDPVQARQAFAHPVTQDALNMLNPGLADSLIKKYGVADTRKYFRGRNA